MWWWMKIKCEACVHPALQGQGVGSQLIAYVKSQMAEEQVGNMALTTEKDSPAVRFYEKNGFKIKPDIVFMHD